MPDAGQPLGKPGPAWKAAEAYGFDMSLIEANLALTPLERIRAHNRALNTALELRSAMERAVNRRTGEQANG